jgi:tripartite-type tricarboxylate transporter receptor subunit TctC
MREGFTAIMADRQERPMTRTLLSAALFVLVTSLGSTWAQDYPARRVKILVPYAAGGVPDVLARVVGQRLSEALSQQFVVENKPGAGGIPAVMTVVKAPADGYTLLIADVAQTAINPHLFEKLPYDTLKDLAPVSIVASSPIYVVVSPSVRIDSFAELIAYAKAHPNRLSYGSAGIGSIHHISME